MIDVDRMYGLLLVVILGEHTIINATIDCTIDGSQYFYRWYC
jgi:hypothetical protein